MTRTSSASRTNALDAARAGDLRIRPREEEERARVPPVRDPLLRAGDAPAVAFRVGARAQRARVRSGLGLGERERAEMLAARERRHEARPLLVGAEREERQRHRTRVHGDRHADAGVRARELLEHEDVREEVRARTPVLLGDARSHQAELGELREELAREAVVAIPLGGVRLDLLAGEFARERLDLALLRAEVEIHETDFSRRVRRWSPRLPPRRPRSSGSGARR